MKKRSSKKFPLNGRQTCVRLTEDEHTRLQNDSELTGESIPDLLKRKYFSGQLLMPLLSHEDTTRLFGTLGRIGNNLNQIAKSLNGGVREGFFDEIKEIQDTFAGLWKFFSSKYCRCSGAESVR